MPKRFFKFVLRVVVESAVWDMVKDHIWPWVLSNVKTLLGTIVGIVVSAVGRLQDIETFWVIIGVLVGVAATISIVTNFQQRRRGSGAGNESELSPAAFNVRMIRSIIQTVELSGLNSSDPFIIVRLQVSQVSGRRMVINGVHGSINCNGELCLTPPQLVASLDLSGSTNDHRNCDIRQQITAAMADKIKADLAPEDGRLRLGLNLTLNGTTEDGIEFSEAWLTEQVATVPGPVLFDQEHQGELRELFRWEVIIAHQNNYSTLGVRKEKS